MAKNWDEDFANIVNTLNHLESVWSRTKSEGGNTTAIQQRISELCSQMTDEQLQAYEEYAKERENQAARELTRLKESLAEAKAELARRKNK